MNQGTDRKCVKREFPPAHVFDDNSEDSPYQYGEIEEPEEKKPFLNIVKPPVTLKERETVAQPSTEYMPLALPEVPYQPDEVPPYRDRRRHHLFQKKWYKMYPWLHFDAASESMFCFQCLSSILQGQYTSSWGNIFCNGGFRNWKKGVERFRVHENSPVHKETLAFSVKPLFDLKEKCYGVEIIISTINFLINVGYDIRQPHLNKLLELRQMDSPILEEHLGKANFSKPDELTLLSMMKASTMRTVSSLIKEAGPYRLILEKVSIHGKTMFAVSARVSPAMKPEEFFLGLYDDDNILHELVNYLVAEDLWVYSCDAKNIADTLESIQPGVLRVRCPNHSLSADLQDVLKTSSTAGRDALLFIEEIVSTLPEREFNDLAQEDDMKPLCPKKIYNIAKILPYVLNNYEDIRTKLVTASEQNRKFSSSQLLKEMENPRILFNLLMLKTLLYPVDNLGKIIDKSESVRCLKEAVNSVLQILQSSRDEKDFEIFWEKYSKTCANLNISADLNNKTVQREAYFETIDIISDHLKAIFNHQSYDELLKMEDVLLLNDEAAIKRAETLLRENRIEPDAIAMEKQMLMKIIHSDNNDKCSLTKLLSGLQSLPAGTLALLPQIVKLADRLILARVAESGEGHFRMENVRKFLESSRCPDMINEMSILYVYRSEPFMNIQEVAREYLIADQARLAALRPQGIDMDETDGNIVQLQLK